MIARVIRDPARAEELAVEVLWKFWRTPRAQGEQAGGWLYRTAVRTGLNELRSRLRSNRHERMSDATPGAPDPEQVRAAAEMQEHVRAVLGALDPAAGRVAAAARQRSQLCGSGRRPGTESGIRRHPDQPRAAGVPKGVYPTIWRTMKCMTHGWIAAWKH